MTNGKNDELLRLQKTIEAMRGLIKTNPPDPHENYLDNYKTILGGIGEGAYIADGAGTVLHLNGAMECQTGRKASELINSPFTLLFEDSGAEKAKKLLASAMKGESPACELSLRGEGIVCEVRHFPLKDARDVIIGVCGIIMDASCRGDLESLVLKRTEQLLAANQMLLDEICERKKAEFELKKLGAVIEQAGNIVFITDSLGKIEYVNRAFEAATGYSREEIAGKTPCLLLSGKVECENHQRLWDTLFSSGGWQGTLKEYRKDGTEFWTKGVISPVMDEDGRTTHYFSVFEDITEKKASSEKLVYLTHYDPITGLLNRSRFIELLTGRLGLSDASTGALLLLDIDQFKFISDSFGHGMGDEFLRRAAKLLQLSMRYFSSRFREKGKGEILLSRLSGDEFAVFLPGACRVEAVEVAEHVRKGFEGFYQPDMHCHMTVSIGMALFPEHASSTTDLLTKADAAMYRAKDKGRNRFHLYSPEEREIEQMHMRLKWKEKILAAIKDDRFEPWYQPIMGLDDNRVTHYEALARMREPDGTIVLPGPFIDIAERFGLVGAISRAVFTKAFATQIEFQKAGRPVRLCLNISGKELGDREFLYYLQGSIFEKGLDPGNIVFEITETASIHDLDKAMSFISSLKEMGCHVSLDDFGIGFTSFLYLREMQVDYIKIAGSFIKSLNKNLNDQLFVKAITDVATGMGIKTIAEFVETEEILGLVKKFGVDYAQGYLVGKPTPGLLPPDYSPALANG